MVITKQGEKCVKEELVSVFQRGRIGQVSQIFFYRWNNLKAERKEVKSVMSSKAIHK